MRTLLSMTSVTSSSSPVEFDPVTSRADAVVIIASGPSYRDFNFRDLAPHVHIIAVKGAIEGLGRRAHSWITVDANRKVRSLWMGHMTRVPGVHYYAAVPEDYGTAKARMKWHRPPAEEGIHWLKRISGLGLSEDPSVIHTGNSAWAALGLAYHMQASKIALVGVDGTQEAYGVGQGSPRGDLSHLSALFATAKAQIKRRGASIRSTGKLAAFDRETPKEVIKWLNDA